MTSSPRIGLLTPGWPGQNTPNGIATAVYNLATGLRDIGKSPVIIAQSIDGPCPAGIPVVAVPQLDWRWQERLRAKLGDTSAVHRHIARSISTAVGVAIKAHDINVFIMEETNGWAAMLHPRLPIPVIVTLHGPWVLHKALTSLGASEDVRREHREQKGFRAAAGIIAPSRSVLSAVEETALLPSTPKIVLPNAYAAEAGISLSIDLPNRDILFVGRFDLHKGGDVVLEAFSRLLETHPHARLTFVGPDRGVKQPDGSKRHMEAALADLPERTSERLRYTGPLGRADVAQLRRQHAIALVASRYENLNYTLLEAMAAGQAIVCTNVGGPAEVLRDDQTALLVPSGDAAAMATALGRLMQDATLALQLGKAAQQQVQREFDPKSIAAQTATFVETVFKARKN